MVGRFLYSIWSGKILILNRSWKVKENYSKKDSKSPVDKLKCSNNSKESEKRETDKWKAEETNRKQIV